MLQEGNYDVLEFTLPPQGMNQNVSPEILDGSFAYILENIVPKPLGEGHVRFGTKLCNSALNPEVKIIKQFPYVAANGVEQLILYVQEYTQDATAGNFQIINDFSFSFTTDTPLNYIKDTLIKIEYNFNGLNTVYDLMTNIQVAGNTVTVTISQNNFPQPFNQIQFQHISFSTGTLYPYDVKTATIGNALRQNMSVACVPRSVVFLNKLLICNGVDRVLMWDGNALTEVIDFVKESAAALTRIDNNNFSFTCAANFVLTKYIDGNFRNIIQVSVNNVPTQLQITNAVRNVNTVTITTAGVLPAFVQNQTQLFYRDWVPRFSFMYVAYNRVWALGEGAVGLSFRDPDQALRVYYPYKSNSLTDWFNENTKTVPSLDLTEQHGVSDNLEAISYINGYMVFMGRVKTQIWTGSEPLGNIAENKNVMQYNSTLPVGLIHGDLMTELPNDIFFITKTGLQSFNTLNISAQFAANSYDAVDPLIREYLTSVMVSNYEYRTCSSFKYDGGALAGFKIGFNKVLCSLFSTSLYSWTLFSGDFEQASSFSMLNNNFYIGIKNTLFKYADGNDGDIKVYGDQGGKGLVYYLWTLPVVAFKGRRFANKRYEIQMDYPSSFIIRPDNQMTISVSGDLPKSYQITNPCRFDLRGDTLQTVPLTSDNPATQNSKGFRFDQPYGFFKDRMKFLASKFWLTVSGWTKEGEVSLKRIKLYGIIERK